MTDSTTITITGSSFEASNTRVVIGGQECAVTSSTSSEVTCDVGRLPVGDNLISVYVGTKGKAAVSDVINSPKSASVNQPTESSVNGGAELVIDGNGFVVNTTSVDVGGQDCPVNSVSFDEVSSFSSSRI